MIYFDNGATTLYKPPSVGEAVHRAINTLGNPGRSFHSPAMAAARDVYAAREEIARLTGLSDPLRVAFTSSATESLNLVADALLDDGDEVVTTALEHNSVLRPLYRKGCRVKILGCGDNGVLLYNELPGLITSGTKAVFATHGSNILGNITDVRLLYAACREKNVPLVLDASQTLGCVDVAADMADIICFTGHKGLFGPQGTGGIIIARDLDKPLKITKTGGSGDNSFDILQPADMPGLFEAGTMNAHGLCGLRAGASFVNSIGIGEIHKRHTALTRAFVEGVQDMPGVILYGDFSGDRLPIVSLNIGNLDSSNAAAELWDKHGVAVRSGIHCAPLLHNHFGTATRGMVRFSFCYLNTEDEILAGIDAIRALASGEE